MGRARGITDRGWGGGKSSNPHKPEPHTQEPNKLPSIADSDPAGNKITTNYPVKDSAANRQKTRGSDIKPQKLRGYVLNEKSIGITNVDNGNARRGSPPTIREISGPGS